MYRATPNLSRLFSDEELQKSSLTFVTKESETTSEKVKTLWFYPN